MSPAFELRPFHVDSAAGSLRLTRPYAKSIAEDTVASCEAGWYETRSGASVELQVARAVETTRLHPAGAALPKAAAPKLEGPCQVSVVLASTLEAAEALAAQGATPCVLNFASAKNPGGGFLNGANAQEESLARSSGLYPCLVRPEVQAFYEDNKRDQTCIYTDHMIMSPEVPVFKRCNGTPLDAPYTIAVATSPAPNLGVARARAQLPEICAARRQRMERVLRLCAGDELDTLVLGAWGCGVFKNDPGEVAAEFRAALEGPLRGAFSRVVFAIIDKPTHDVFEQTFSGSPQAPKPRLPPASSIAKPRPAPARAGAASSGGGVPSAGPAAGKQGRHAGGRKARRWAKTAGESES